MTLSYSEPKALPWAGLSGLFEATHRFFRRSIGSSWASIASSGQRPAASQPRASEERAPPWVWKQRMTNAPTGLRKDGLPCPVGAWIAMLRGTQGGVRVRRGLALGWLASGRWPTNPRAAVLVRSFHPVVRVRWFNRDGSCAALQSHTYRSSISISCLRHNARNSS